ncbi:hypothetical protein BOX15_Mlig014117g3 [Macrostomum lignano]|uniref:Uncharacterized protein n=1 Tax=Macrostomum lignano TaxID=282301 RepID=A0A267FMU7_9PLAT|nr:hypothetical protein BOX15_Mlig014117g3 [Macrostomum lignano]
MRSGRFRASPLQLGLVCLYLAGAAATASAAAVAAAAAAAASSVTPAVKAPVVPSPSLPVRSGGDGSGADKRFFRVMNCAERCESFNIKVFKAYWAIHHSNMNFIQYLRDLVVWSTLHKDELGSFKRVLDKAVRDYEICRYATCGTDYLMG